MGVLFERDTDDLRRYLSELDGQMRAFDRDMTRLAAAPNVAKRPTAGMLGSWIGIYYGPPMPGQEGEPIGWRIFYDRYTSLLTAPLVFTDLDRVFAQAEAFEFKLSLLRVEVGEAHLIESRPSPLGPDFDTASSAKGVASGAASIAPLAITGLALITAIALLRK